MVYSYSSNWKELKTLLLTLQHLEDIMDAMVTWS